MKKLLTLTLFGLLLSGCTIHTRTSYYPRPYVYQPYYAPYQVYQRPVYQPRNCYQAYDRFYQRTRLICN